MDLAGGNAHVSKKGCVSPVARHRTAMTRSHPGMDPRGERPDGRREVWGKARLLRSSGWVYKDGLALEGASLP